MLSRSRSLASSFALVLATLSLSARGQHAAFEDRARPSFAAPVLVLGAHHARPSYSKCSPSVWVPGRYETRCERVWVPGCSRQVWSPASFEWRWDGCGRMYRVCVSAGHWTTVTDPGHYESRESQVWVPGHWRAA